MFNIPNFQNLSASELAAHILFNLFLGKQVNPDQSHPFSTRVEGLFVTKNYLGDDPVAGLLGQLLTFENLSFEELEATHPKQTLAFLMFENNRHKIKLLRILFNKSQALGFIYELADLDTPVEIIAVCTDYSKSPTISDVANKFAALLPGLHFPIVFAWEQSQLLQESAKRDGYLMSPIDQSGFPNSNTDKSEEWLRSHATLIYGRAMYRKEPDSKFWV